MQLLVVSYYKLAGSLASFVLLVLVHHPWTVKVESGFQLAFQKILARAHRKLVVSHDLFKSRLDKVLVGYLKDSLSAVNELANV